jgi:hypothetical protein
MAKHGFAEFLGAEPDSLCSAGTFAKIFRYLLAMQQMAVDDFAP